MDIHRVEIDHDFQVPVERLFDYLSEHENLKTLFGIRVERVKDGDTDRNGVGSARKLSFFGLAPFVETVTGVVPNETIEYRITKGSPLKHHRGIQTFSTRPGGGSHLNYVIELGSPIPFLGKIVKATLGTNIKRGLAKVDAQA